MLVTMKVDVVYVHVKADCLHLFVLVMPFHYLIQVLDSKVFVQLHPQVNLNMEIEAHV